MLRPVRSPEPGEFRLGLRYRRAGLAPVVRCFGASVAASFGRLYCGGSQLDGLGLRQGRHSGAGALPRDRETGASEAGVLQPPGFVCDPRPFASARRRDAIDAHLTHDGVEGVESYSNAIDATSSRDRVASMASAAPHTRRHRPIQHAGPTSPGPSPRPTFTRPSSSTPSPRRL